MQNSFDTLHLKNELITALQAQNITKPTAVQAMTYPAFLEGRDLVVESHTGSGKTLAFLLPLFIKIKNDEARNQALILAPTHELAHQIQEQIKLLAKNSQMPITSTLLMGEVSIEKQIERLKKHPHILVGSPGRILDLMLKKKIDIEAIETVILDEADNLLESSQNTTVKKLLYQIQHPVQVTMFSASMSEKVRHLAAPFLKNPVFLHTAPQTALSPLVSHFYIKTEVRDKFETLKKLLQSTKTNRALIFVSQHTNTEVMVEKLSYHGFSVATISGKCSKEERKSALTAFKVGKVSILLSSDLSARGLDVSRITHIFHYDLPLRPEDYLHRSGRSGRNGHLGQSILLITPKDLGMMRILERTFNVQLNELLLTKGKIKDLNNDDFLPILEGPSFSHESPKPKSRNKYPKGFVSDSGKRATKDKTQSKPIKEPPKKQPPKKKSFSSSKVAASTDEGLLSGTLADALKLIEAHQLDD